MFYIYRCPEHKVLQNSRRTPATKGSKNTSNVRCGRHNRIPTNNHSPPKLDGRVTPVTFYRPVQRHITGRRYPSGTVTSRSTRLATDRRQIAGRRYFARTETS